MHWSQKNRINRYMAGLINPAIIRGYEFLFVLSNYRRFRLMVNVLFAKKIKLDEAATVTGKKLLEYPDALFRYLTRGYDLNKDEIFVKALLDIDKCDIPMDNVARDLLTGRTHSFDKVSTGVMTVWLLSKCSEEYLLETKWLGENCYRSVFELAKDRDIYLYDNSQMFLTDEVEECNSDWKDYHTGNVVNVTDSFDYCVDMGY